MRFFIVLVLLLGLLVALGEIGYSLFGNKESTLDPSITAIQPLPSALPIEFIDKYSERATKYIFLTAKQFEEGVNPETLRGGESGSGSGQGTPTPTPTLSGQDTSGAF